MTGVLVLAIRQLQAGAILEPMSVFGARRPAADRGGYLGFVLALHGLGVGAPTLVLAAATGLATAAGLVGSAGWAVVAALVYANAVALLNLLRRQFYVDERPDLALAQSVAVLGLSLAGLVLLALAGRGASPAVGVVAVYGVLTAAALLGLLVRGRRLAAAAARPGAVARRRYLGEHRRYGAWSLLTVPAAIAAYQGYFVLAGVLSSVEESGLLKAADTLVAPFAQVAIGLSLMFVPIVARRLAGDPADRAAAGRIAHGLAAAMLALALLYAALIVFVGDALIAFVFGRHMREAGELALWLAPLPVTVALQVPAAVMLAAHGRADLRFRATAVAALAGTACGVPLIVGFGPTGAAAGLVLGQAVLAAGLWLAYRRCRRPPAGEAPPDGRS
jgi:O-antigen/teichoic acid export membrane protein